MKIEKRLHVPARLLGIAACSGAALLALAGSRAWAERVHPRAGTSSAAFLKIGVGARPVGMGEAFTAVSDDAHSIYWNPAGLAGLGRGVASFTHHESFQGLKQDFLGYAQPIKRSASGAAWGLGFISLTMPSDMERRSGLNEGGTLNPVLSGSEGSFGAYDLALSASYARRFGTAHAAGATLKFIRQVIDKEAGQTFAADFGAQVSGPIDNLRFGAALQNLGPGVKIVSRYDLPLSFRAGAAYKAQPLRSLMALDVAIPRDDYPWISFGAETKLGPIALRAGYRYRAYGNPLGVLSGFRSGLGISFENLQLDYAFAPFGELGQAHRASVSWRFSRGRTLSRGEAGPSKAGNISAAAPPAPAAAPTPQAVAGTPAAGPVPEPAPGSVLEPAFLALRTTAAPKVISGQRSDYLVKAMSPDEWPLRWISFRTALASPETISVAAAAAPPLKPLPQGRRLRWSCRLRLSVQPNAIRSVEVGIRPEASKPALLGLFEDQWKALEPAEAAAADGSLLFRSDRVPEALALAEAGGPETSPR